MTGVLEEARKLLDELEKETINMNSKYVNFNLVAMKPKTNIYDIVSKSSYESLGEILWYAPWRQYCFIPTAEFETVWSKGCLKDVYDYIEILMKEQKQQKHGSANRTKSILCVGEEK